MRYSIIPFFVLLFVSSFLAAQSTPVSTPLEIISEDDLKLGIYDAPIFQPSARDLTVRQAEEKSKDCELLLVLGQDPDKPTLVRFSPSFYRLYLACRQQTNPEDALAVVYELLNLEDTRRLEVVVHH